MAQIRGGSEITIPQQLEQSKKSTKSLVQAFTALIKIGIVNSNLITTFTGIWLAMYFSGLSFLSNLHIVFYTLVGSALIMAGSCAINNYYDRDIDQLMERTKNRPTVTGQVNNFQVLTLGIAFILLGIVSLMFTTPTATLIGIVGVFSYVFVYTMWTKRRYATNTIVGSIPGAIPPLIGWAAIDPDLSTVAWVLFLIMFFWQPPHFLALAMKRVEEYRAAGIPMLPVVYGFAVTKRMMTIWVICLLPLPFYLFSLGTGFIVLATILNIGWIVLALSGFKTKDDIKWSQRMFVYSLNYLTILFVAMVIFTANWN
ncbi:heme o synthase [Bacillus carboniphilus]|uniref:Protoheme IX farnesyltransferase n=1 Tax=Bacillus carboniphilus TaxID=86663 RepID=A0ABY9JW70_9BACI|nr:heme o synthase [Bacillus carboniphilus]WLR43657.1 heme o synthase [Bacillus carboniphilus]